MTRLPSWLMAIIAVVLAVFGGRAISAQDKYTAQVPNGLAFSEFKGYEDWKVISVSHSGDVLAVILGNPEMIAAYQVDVMQAVRHRRRSGGLRARFRIPMDFRNLGAVGKRLAVARNAGLVDSGNWGYGQRQVVSHPRGMAPRAGFRATRS